MRHCLARTWDRAPSGSERGTRGLPTRASTTLPDSFSLHAGRKDETHQCSFNRRHWLATCTAGPCLFTGTALILLSRLLWFAHHGAVDVKRWFADRTVTHAWRRRVSFLSFSVLQHFPLPCLLHLLPLPSLRAHAALHEHLCAACLPALPRFCAAHFAHAYLAAALPSRWRSRAYASCAARACAARHMRQCGAAVSTWFGGTFPVPSCVHRIILLPDRDAAFA